MNFYNEYMLSDAWRDKRQERLQLDGHKCRTCGCSADFYPLQVHHITYERLGHEDVANDLITLCADCHHAITDVMRRRRYTDRDIKFEPITATVTTRSEVNIYGMGNTEIQVDIRVSDVDARGDDRRSAAPVGEGIEAHLWQEKQDGRRPRTDGTD